VLFRSADLRREPVRPRKNAQDMTGAPPVDFAGLAALTGEDDPHELTDIVARFVATAEPALQRARDAIAAQDNEALLEAAHAGRGSALAVCATPLAQAWAAIEQDVAGKRDPRLAFEGVLHAFAVVRSLNRPIEVLRES